MRVNRYTIAVSCILVGVLSGCAGLGSQSNAWSPPAAVELGADTVDRGSALANPAVWNAGDAYEPDDLSSAVPLPESPELVERTLDPGDIDWIALEGGESSSRTIALAVVPLWETSAAEIRYATAERLYPPAYTVSGDAEPISITEFSSLGATEPVFLRVRGTGLGAVVYRYIETP